MDGKVGQVSAFRRVEPGKGPNGYIDVELS